MAWAEKYASTAGGGAHDGSSESNAWSISEAISNAAAGDRVNFKGNHSGDVTFNNANGTAALPIWWRGYKTTIGDLDGTTGDASTPTITGAGSAAHAFSAAHHRYSNLNFLNSRTTYSARATVATQIFDRCRFENTNTGSGAYAWALGASGPIMIRCNFKVHANSTAGIVTPGSYTSALFACTFTGSSGATGVALTTHSSIINCVFQTLSYGITCSGANTYLFIGNTFDAITNDCISMTTAPGTTAGRGAINNVFANAVNGINQTSGTNCSSFPLMNNLAYNLSGAKYVGFGDVPDIDGQTDTSSPFVSSSNLNLVSGSNGKGNGFPSGNFENTSYHGHADIGAVQREEVAADYPSEDDVRDGVTFDTGAQEGNMVLPAITDVKDGVTYGTDGTEFEGTLVVSGGATTISGRPEIRGANL